MVRQPYKTLSLEQLGNFCEVMRHGGYAEAARQTDLSAATLWEQVRALERHYGVALFRREGRTVKPTDEDISLQMMNICRCGTYPRIRKAVHRAAELWTDAAAGLNSEGKNV